MLQMSWNISEVLAATKMNNTIYFSLAYLFSLFFAKHYFTLKNQKNITTISFVK